VPLPAQAHSYADPALTTVFDGVQPALPAGVVVDVRPSVVDTLVVANSTATPLEVLAVGGEPFLRVSSAGVFANLASPDWYATGTPEGGPRPPAFDRSEATPRWARVSTGTGWSEFDPRLRPAVAVPAGIRAAGVDRILTGWRIPLRFGSADLVATGHIAFRPVRGGLVVAVARAPVPVTPLQGELPGLFLKVPPGKDVVVEGRDHLPFLRFHKGVVSANTASASWRDDRAARGLAAPDRGWVRVGTGSSFSWLDTRLRYARDVPPDPGTPSVVLRWSLPVVVDGTQSSIEGTVSWVPRAACCLASSKGPDRSPSWRWFAVPALLVVLGSVLAARRHRRQITQGPSRPNAGQPRT
jgi:hypothetical protein